VKHVVCRRDALKNGSMIETKIGKMPVLVIKTEEGQLYALAGRCLHQGGPLPQGILTGTTLPADDVGDYRWGLDGHVVRCPWHGYEYDVTTGCTLFDETRRLRTFAVTEDEDDVVVHL
jgi:nitrite reductase/ring-hydroxylating ferredoxin subunit